MGRAVLTVMAAFAQLERDNLVERTKAGLAVARAEGREGGRPRSLDSKQVRKLHRMKESNPNLKAKDLAAIFGVSRATIYRYLDEKESANA
jgi:DNA invertase Pin-like site-specific DNA recombinase